MIGLRSLADLPRRRHGCMADAAWLLNGIQIISDFNVCEDLLNEPAHL